MALLLCDDTGVVIEEVTEETILNTLIDYFRTAQTSITDFNEGSEARNLLSAVALSLYENSYYQGINLMMAYPQTAEGEYLDAIGLGCNCTRLPANKSTGTVTFSIGSSVASDITITSGEVLSSSDDPDLTFVTTEDCTILAGTTSITCDAESETGGTDGNVAIGVIDTIEEDDSGYYLSVTNAAAFTGGTDTETDDSYRERILDAEKANNIGTLPWYQSTAETVTGVHDASITNMPFSNSFNVLILVNGETRPTPSDVLTDVEELFTDEENMIGGITVQVDKPDYTVLDMSITLTILDGYSFGTVSTNVEANLTDYINGGTTTYGNEYSGLNIGDDAILSTLHMIIGNTAGVSDWTITTPSSNVLIGSNGAIQKGTITITEAT